jgi:Response regulators consisting of a CheY-like receiver domain and a winged-helix DNA-binding domain
MIPKGETMAIETIPALMKQVYRDDQLEIDFVRGQALVQGNQLVLTRKEFELLAMLAANEGEIVPREVLMKRIWGYSMEIRTRTLDVHVRRLRRKIMEFGQPCIETVFGVGYRFQRFRADRQRQSYSNVACVAVPA